MKNLLRTLLLGLTAAATTMAYAADGPKETVQTFFESLINGDASKAAALTYLPPEAEQQGNHRAVHARRTRHVLNGTA